jgi:uncharacterized protein (TIGR02117 family)
MSGKPYSKRQRVWRRIAKGLALLVGVPLFYILAGIIGSIIPANADWQELREGVPIYVGTNGVHTWIALPTVTEDVDWRPIADPAHIADPRYAGDYLAFGFGNRDFYLNTPTWADLKLSTALAAFFGRGPALVHIDHLRDPKADEYQSRLLVTPEQYRRLAAHIRRSFRFDAQGEPIPLLGRGYGPADVFYEARGPYNGARTCNAWTGVALRAAGIRTGVRTPFSQSVMWRLETGSVE